jgi:hypothetical protein
VRGFTKTLTLAALVAAMAACEQSRVVAPGPIRLDATPREIVFVEPVHAAGATGELCLEFDPPGGSHQAGKIHVVLLTTKGARTTWQKPSLDRRGEATVCLVDESPVSATLSESGEAAGVDYRGVELSSDVPVALRQIRWGIDG